MRRVKLLRHPGRSGTPLGLADLGAGRNRELPEQEAMLYFRHRCSEEWYESVIESCGLKGKKITPSRLRKLIVMALQKRREETE
jgi:hypothetical protein